MGAWQNFMMTGGGLLNVSPLSISIPFTPIIPPKTGRIALLANGKRALLVDGTQALIQSLQGQMALLANGKIALLANGNIAVI